MIENQLDGENNTLKHAADILLFGKGHSFYRVIMKLNNNLSVIEQC